MNKIINRMFLLILVTFPVLELYATPIPKIGVADALLLILFPFLVYSEIKNGFKITQIRVFILIYLLMIIINLGIVFLYNFNDYNDVLTRSFRYLFYWTALFFVEKNKNIDFFLKSYLTVSIFGTIILFIQIIVMEIYGHFIVARVPFFPLMDSRALQNQIYNIYNYNGRPMSIFTEPSAYAQYVAGALWIEVLFNKGKRIKICMFLSIGLLVCLSNTGFALLGVLLLIILFNNIKKRLFDYRGKKIIIKNKNLVIISTFALLVIIVIFIRYDYINDLWNRISNPIHYTQRFGGFIHINKNAKWYETLFGNGMNLYEGVYLSGVVRLYHYFGLIGVLLIFLSGVYLYKRMEFPSKMILIFILVSNFGGAMLFGQELFCIIPVLECIKITKHQRKKIINMSM